MSLFTDRVVVGSRRFHVPLCGAAEIKVVFPNGFGIEAKRGPDVSGSDDISFSVKVVRADRNGNLRYFRSKHLSPPESTLNWVTAEGVSKLAEFVSTVPPNGAPKREESWNRKGFTMIASM